jgi:hypothetical protein
MCNQFDVIFAGYETGVTLGAMAYNARQQIPQRGAAYRALAAAEHEGHLMVSRARTALDQHKRGCSECKHLLTARMTARKPAEVDPAELRDLPLLEMIAEAG